ncbi:MAG: 1-hydroxycarotenoid 3,4-desaturase CrtD, partial [Pseudomonadota bacterium]
RPGGKIRSVPSALGPVAAGPTVLTLKAVFDDVFAALGEHLDDHLCMRKLPVIARHFWPDGSRLDLTDSPEANRAAIASFSGEDAAAAFIRFHEDTRALFEHFERPMMCSPRPSLATLGLTVLRRPSLSRAMAPLRSLGAHLAGRFSDARLAQLFGRYATYVGGSPYLSPALLSLIWQAEATGVWHVEGGLHRLPDALEKLCRNRGATFLYDSHVTLIECDGGRVATVEIEGQRRITADIVVFNGDPRALARGALGNDVERAAHQTLTAPRSLSAAVWSFAATVSGPDLSHHNVFFSGNGQREFEELRTGFFPEDPTIYICAQDRGPGKARTPGAAERFEIILNAPPRDGGSYPDMEFQTCLTRTFGMLRRFGLTFDPLPGPASLTRPQDFEAMFPESSGSLYGQSPHGLTAALNRPRARTPIRGLYLAGGGTHPGAGLPMAALSARHAVETIVADLALRSTFRRTVMPGGMSTGSATIGPGPFRS